MEPKIPVVEPKTPVAGPDVTIKFHQGKHDARSLGFQAYNSTNAQGTECVAITLQGEAIDWPMLSASGNHILTNLGCVSVSDGEGCGTHHFMLKEDYDVNLDELLSYSQADGSHPSHLPSHTQSQLKQCLQQLGDNSLYQNGSFTTMGERAVGAVVDCMQSFEEIGIRIADLDAKHITVKFNGDNSLKMKLLGRRKSNIYERRSKFSEFIKFCTNCTKTEDKTEDICRAKPIVRDIWKMLLPLQYPYESTEQIDHHDKIVRHAPYSPTEWDTHAKLHRDLFDEIPRSILSYHPLFFSSRRNVDFIHDASEIIMECGAPRDKHGHFHCCYPIRRFLVGVNNICLGEGTYTSLDGSTVVIDRHPNVSWLELIGMKSGAVAEEARRSYKTNTGELCNYDETQIIHLIRMIRNMFEHFKNLSPDAKAALGDSVDKFFAFFNDLFPHLVIQLFRLFQIHHDKLTPVLRGSLRLKYMTDYFGFPLLNLEGDES